MRKYEVSLGKKAKIFEIKRLKKTKKKDIFDTLLSPEGNCLDRLLENH